MPEIRPYREADLEDLYRICLATGDAGGEASHLYADPKILGHVFAAPYGVLSPRTAFVVEDDEGVGGYVLGALDTQAFEAMAEERWWPKLRASYADPGPAPEEGWSRDQLMAWVIHHPRRTSRRIADPYPSHVHIDLLPRLQGRGLGRRMLDLWFETLRDRGSTGVHLGVAPSNARAIRFYRAYGLIEPPAAQGVLWFARGFGSSGEASASSLQPIGSGPHQPGR
jgi:ribosomal protein S18 acetylase RimI-like enzyme